MHVRVSFLKVQKYFSTSVSWNFGTNVIFLVASNISEKLDDVII